jgi:hypothetical protein
VRRVTMSDKTEPKDLETLLAKLKEECQELADLLASQDKSRDRVMEVEKILLRDASGQYRGKISGNADGSADLLLIGQAGSAWTRLGVNQAGEAFLELRDKQGKSSFKVGAEAPSPGAGTGLTATPGDAAHPATPQPIQADASEGEPPGDSDSGPRQPTPDQDVHQEGEANSGVVDRLEKLGRQNRRHTIYWVLVLAVLGVILATQAYVLFRPIPSGLAGESLVVRDANGKIRASLGADGGKVRLDLWDPEGHRRATLGLESEGAPHLRFYDREQRVRAELNLGVDGEPKFILRDKGSLQGNTEPNDISDSSQEAQRVEAGPGSEGGTAASPPATPANPLSSPPAGQTGAVSPSQDAEAEVEFLGSKTSNKYHYPTCRWVKEIRPWNLIKFKSPAEAQARRYIPCPLCQPPPLSR